MPDVHGYEVVADTISENLHRAGDRQWARHVINEIRGTRMEHIKWRLLASVMRDAADIIEYNVDRVKQLEEQLADAQ